MATQVKEEAKTRRIVTYCAGCVNLLSAITPTSHILDLLFEPKATLSGKVRVSRSPITYLNRLKLKKRLKNTVNASITRERTFTGSREEKMAYIVFSSSLLDIIKGEISPTFIAGLGLVILVSLTPLFYRRYKAKKGMTDTL